MGGGAKLAATGVAVGTTISLPSPDPIPDELIRVPAGLLVLGVSATGVYLLNEYVPKRGETVRNEPVTGIEARYPASETALETTVTLPTGGVTTEIDPRTGEQIATGHGWQYIAETTGLTQHEIGELLRHPNAVEQDGQYKIVIGDNPNGQGQIALWLLGGLVTEASSYERIIDPLGRGVYIDEDDPHPVRDGKDTNYEQIKEIIRNPDEIWQGSTADYYVKQLEDGTWRIIKVYTGMRAVRKVSTTIKQKTRREVEEYIENGVSDLLYRIYKSQ